MKWHTALSIKKRIFLSYGSIILVLIMIFCSLYYLTAYNSFINNYTQSSAQLAKITSGQIEQYLDRINSLQKKILESDLIRDYIFENAAQQDIVYDREFKQHMYSITGYDFDFFHMNFLNLEDMTLVTFGNNYSYSTYDVKENQSESLIASAVALWGKKKIVPPCLGKIYNVDKNVDTLSLLRSFPRYSSSPSTPKGILEIQMSYSTISDLISNTLTSYANQAKSVFIFDSNKDLIFPLDTSAEALSFYSTLSLTDKNFYHNPMTGKSEHITGYTSPKTGFTTFIITPESAFLQNKYFFRNISLCIGFLALILLVAISYGVARSISSPILALTKHITSLQLNTIAGVSSFPAESKVIEIDMLSHAYQDMQLRLRKAVEDTIQANSLTMHAQIMALQSQMDSHFLYNTLTIISIIAEENNDLQASEMCLKLTRMLRYITEDYSMSTTFLGELEHAYNYSDLMAIRFGEKISFSYHIADGMNPLFVPRLIIQPLLENCIKYSRNESSRLSISVNAYTEGHFWYIKVMDNGPGFPAEALAKVAEKIKALSASPDYSSLHINGMGLANIYLRLKLFYEDNFYFQIDTPESGSSITIGGQLDYEP